MPRKNSCQPLSRVSSIAEQFLEILCIRSRILSERQVIGSKDYNAPLCLQVRHLLEVEPPGPTRYIIGAAIMMLGVLLPLGCMLFRTKKTPGPSTFGKQT